MARSEKIPVSNDTETDPNSYSLEKFRLYETKARFYLIGSDRKKRFYRVLKIDRMEPSELNISEDPVVYSPQEVKSLLQRIAEGNRATGGLTSVAKVYGIAGCINFLEPYYLILVTKRRQIGCICGHAIYSIDESQLITIPHTSVQTDVAHSKTELRYKKLLTSVDLTKDFFFSYTYPMMQSLQKNMLSMGEEGMPYENIFVWNAFLHIQSGQDLIIQSGQLHWFMIRLSIFGRDFSVSLVSRRSRHFAGTRDSIFHQFLTYDGSSYLKRGVNDRGRVANDVETEQIVLDEEAGSCQRKDEFCVTNAGVQSRYSGHKKLQVQRYDPTYESTKMHFEDLAKRYGKPIIVLNLIKTVEKRPREMMLRREFANAVGYLNQIFPEDNQLEYIHWDFHKFAKSKSANVLAVLGRVASEALDLIGFYYSGKPRVVKRLSTQLSRTSTGRTTSLRDMKANSVDLGRIRSSNDLVNTLLKQEREFDSSLQIPRHNYGVAPLFQSGVLRTNCIDCLDRTNVAQFAYGLAALGRQLHAMGLTNEPIVDGNSSIAAALMELYQSMGDALAQQYGGSAAHNTVFPERQGKWKATTQSSEFLKSIKRYYSNAYTDGEKQDAINLFLGYFQPQEGKPALWELDSDYYLHVSGIGDDLIPYKSLTAESRPIGARTILAPISACKEDFTRIKLTSFDKLIERTCSSIKNVRLCNESEHKSGTSGVAPDAAEIQLKSPNWFFGLRKSEEPNGVPKAASEETSDERAQVLKKLEVFSDHNWISSSGGDTNQEEVFKSYLAMTSVDEANGWYGGSLLGDQDENSEIYKHYAELCQGPAIEPFEDDAEKEKHYAEMLSRSSINHFDDASVETEMEAALKEYELIGTDLGIGIVPESCKYLADDPNILTSWIIGEERMQKL